MVRLRLRFRDCWLCLSAAVVEFDRNGHAYKFSEFQSFILEMKNIVDNEIFVIDSFSTGISVHVAFAIRRQIVFHEVSTDSVGHQSLSELKCY